MRAGATFAVPLMITSHKPPRVLQSCQFTVRLRDRRVTVGSSSWVRYFGAAKIARFIEPSGRLQRILLPSGDHLGFTNSPAASVS